MGIPQQSSFPKIKIEQENPADVNRVAPGEKKVLLPVTLL
jgi:hypothetical protein